MTWAIFNKDSGITVEFFENYEEADKRVKFMNEYHRNSGLAFFIAKIDKKTTVSDLIAHLQKYNPDSEVRVFIKTENADRAFDLEKDIDIDRRTNKVVFDVAYLEFA